MSSQNQYTRPTELTGHYNRLQNPGDEVGPCLEFDSYPHPGEFLRRGGVPGVSYLYLLAENTADAQDAGWATIAGVPFFRVRGNGMTIMAYGKPISQGRATSNKCRCYLDPEAKIRTGIGLVKRSDDSRVPMIPESTAAVPALPDHIAEGLARAAAQVESHRPAAEAASAPLKESVASPIDPSSKKSKA
jgi:hypothetical protein